MKIIFNHKSEAKQSIHFKLKSYIFDHGKSCFSNFVKNDLLKLCKAYAIAASSDTTNDVIKQKLCSIIHSADGVSLPKYLNETTSQATTETDAAGPTISHQEQSVRETSSEQSIAPTAQTHSSEPAKSYVQKQKMRRDKTKLTTKSKKCKKSKSRAQSNKMDNTDTVCPLCKTVYAERGDWIACDICDAWYDRRCLQLDDSQWEALEGNDRCCSVCQVNMKRVLGSNHSILFMPRRECGGEISCTLVCLSARTG